MILEDKEDRAKLENIELNVLSTCYCTQQRIQFYFLYLLKSPAQLRIYLKTAQAYRINVKKKKKRKIPTEMLLID